MRCATHTRIETNLRCVKLICPKCLKQTLVGARCADCAQLSRLPTYYVPTQYYLRAAGIGLGMAIACGIIWGLVEWMTPRISLDLLISPIVGYAIGEVVSLSVNRKRSIGLVIIGGTIVAISYFITFHFRSWLPLNPLNIVYHLLTLALGISIAATRLR